MADSAATQVSDGLRVGGVIIDAVAELPFSPKSIRIDLEAGRVALDRSTFSSGLTAEEFALCASAVLFGDGGTRLGAVSQDRVVGIWDDCEVAWHLMKADGFLGGIAYGYDPYFAVHQAHLPGYVNPFLEKVEEVCSLATPCLFEVALDEIAGEGQLRVFVNYHAVRFTSSGWWNPILKADVSLRASLGEKLTETTAADDGASVALKYRTTWEALQHFVGAAHTQYQQLCPSFARLPLYAALVGLLRALYRTGWEPPSDVSDAISARANGRVKYTLPWLNYTRRSREFEAACKRVVDVMRSRLADATSERERFAVAVIGLIYARRAGLHQAFFDFRAVALAEVNAATSSSAESLSELRQTIAGIKHDILIDACQACWSLNHSDSDKQEAATRAVNLSQAAEAGGEELDLARHYLVRAWHHGINGRTSEAAAYYEEAAVAYGEAFSRYSGAGVSDLALVAARGAAAAWDEVWSLLEKRSTAVERQVLDWHSRIVEMSNIIVGKDAAHVRASDLRELGEAYGRNFQWQQAAAVSELAYREFVELNEPGWIAYCAHQVGFYLFWQAEHLKAAEESRPLYEASVRWFRIALQQREAHQRSGPHDERSSMAVHHRLLALSSFRLGDKRTASASLAAAQKLFQDVGDTEMAARCAADAKALQ